MRGAARAPIAGLARRAAGLPRAHAGVLRPRPLGGWAAATAAVPAPAAAAAPALGHRLPCGNEVTLLNDGVECFPALFEAIDSAREEVLFEMYWFESDRAGRAVAERLKAAADRGVAVRVVYDSFGSMDADQGMFEDLRAHGCEVLEYNPIPPWRHRFHLDRLFRRNHRKMVVVDRRVALTGGMNIGDYWLPMEDGGGGWRDMMVRVEGPVAPAFAGIFERLICELRAGHDDRGPLEGENSLGLPLAPHPGWWTRMTLALARRRSRLSELRDQVAASVNKGKDVLNTSLYKRLSALPDNTMLLFPFDVLSNGGASPPRAEAASAAWWSAQGRLRLDWGRRHGKSRRSLQFQQIKSKWQTLGSHVQIITNDALSERNTIRRGYLRAINSAKTSITIANSYFVPCTSIRRALYRAADRGVAVRIIVPGSKTDLHSVRFATRAMYDHMLRRGIKLYEFVPSVLHTKVCVIDSAVSTLGTYNLDYRSWYHNLELVAIVHDGAFARQVEATIQHDIDHHCEEVELLSWSARPFLQRLYEQFFYTFRHHM